MEDTCSLNEIRGILRKSKVISNKEDDIKKDGNYEKHKKFFQEVGHEFIKSSFEAFAKEAKPEFEETKEGAIVLIRTYMKEKGIKWLWEPKCDEPVYLDRAHEVGCDLIVRTLIVDVLELIIHNGDSTGLHAVWRYLVVFYLNSKDTQRSKYAYEMLLNIVTYEGLSSRNKLRHDVSWYVNLSGKKGKCVAADQCVEWIVKYVKSGYRSLGSQLDYIQIKKMVGTLNMTMELIDHDKQSMGLEGGIGGKTSHSFLTELEVTRVAKHLKQCELFSNSRIPIAYIGTYRMVHQSAVMTEFLRFLKRNQFSYATKTPH